jgi:hypothetical protein
MFLTRKPDVLGWVIMTNGNEVKPSNAVGERDLKVTIMHWKIKVLLKGTSGWTCVPIRRKMFYTLARNVLPTSAYFTKKEVFHG